MPISTRSDKRGMAAIRRRREARGEQECPLGRWSEPGRAAHVRPPSIADLARMSRGGGNGRDSGNAIEHDVIRVRVPHGLGRATTAVRVPHGRSHATCRRGIPVRPAGENRCHPHISQQMLIRISRHRSIPPSLHPAIAPSRHRSIPPSLNPEIPKSPNSFRRASSQSPIRGLSAT